MFSAVNLPAVKKYNDDNVVEIYLFFSKKKFYLHFILRDYRGTLASLITIEFSVSSAVNHSNENGFT